MHSFVFAPKRESRDNRASDVISPALSAKDMEKYGGKYLWWEILLNLTSI